MGTAPRLNLSGPVCAESGVGDAPEMPAQTAAPAATQQELPAELGGESVSYPEWRIEELARKYGEYDGR